MGMYNVLRQALQGGIIRVVHTQFSSLNSVSEIKTDILQSADFEVKNLNKCNTILIQLNIVNTSYMTRKI